MLRIGDFSKLSRVSIRMLRHYDEIGLLVPVWVDPDSLYRYYSENQLSIAARITSLKDMGFGLSEIGEMLECYDDKDILNEHLQMKRSELLETINRQQYRMRLLDTAIERLRKDDGRMKYDVTLKKFPKRYAATVRQIIPSYEDEGQLWNILMNETAQMNLIDGDPCYCSAMFHDKEYKESGVDVEVQKSVKGHYHNTEHVIFKEVEEVSAACAICKGSYEQMSAVTEAVAKWVVDNGYELDGAVFYIYHVSPHETDDPNEFVTEVCFPVKKI